MLGKSSRPILASFILATAVFLLYLPTISYDFIPCDDDVYVTENPAVRDGLTVRGFQWAFRDTGSGNWHPLTWLSHMLDVQLFSMWPGGHHLTNVMLHVASTILLFRVLLSWSGAFSPSFVAALLFGIHPLHVESVIWIAERKDVLSGLFFMMTLSAYTAYVRRPCLPRIIAVSGCMALGLLAKPMVVTMPFVLLLADFWPLGRLTRLPAEASGGKAPLRLVVEKMPLFGLAIAASLITVAVQARAGAMTMLGNLPWSARFANAIDAYLRYLAKMLWPRDLVVFYPHQGDALATWKVIAAATILLAISAAAVAGRRRFGYVAFGWFWFLGTLVPVIGIVQVGMQAMADRYTYLPLIGPIIIVTWTLRDLSNHLTGGRVKSLITPAICVALLGVFLLGMRQVGYWKDAITLFTHAAYAIPGNYLADNNLAVALEHAGNAAKAEEHYRSAVRARPDYYWARFNLGRILYGKGEMEESLAQFSEGLRREPRDERAHLYLGLIFEARGNTRAAAEHFARSTELNPHQAAAWKGLGRASLRLGNTDNALDAFAQALRIEPNDGDAHLDLAEVLLDKGDFPSAEKEVERARQTGAEPAPSLVKRLSAASQRH